MTVVDLDQSANNFASLSICKKSALAKIKFQNRYLSDPTYISMSSLYFSNGLQGRHPPSRFSTKDVKVKSAGIGWFPNENTSTNVIPKDQTSDFVLNSNLLSVSKEAQGHGIDGFLDSNVFSDL